MGLKITKLANLEEDDSRKFLSKVNSKLIMDVRKSQIFENDEWIEMVEFTIPYIEKALVKQIKQMSTEEEVIKVELIRKISVESVKHLTKHVDFIDQYDEETGEVIPKKILNVYKEETFVTYENRFLYTLIKLIDDIIFLREKDLKEESGGKSIRKAKYQAEANLNKEKVKVKLDYVTETPSTEKKRVEMGEKIEKLKKELKTVKSTQLYQKLDAKKVPIVKPPLKMTNVLLKNVNFQYAVKLWNYLSDQLDAKEKEAKENREHEEKGLSKVLLDEEMYLMHRIFQNRKKEAKINKKVINTVEDQKEREELTNIMLNKIFDLNPEMTEEELKRMIGEKYMVRETKRVISLKPIEDKFKDKISEYMDRVKEMRLK